jgi:RNA 3'-terminal phosphate cyclase (ATP)
MSAVNQQQIEIDGSLGEGGGQVLRSALTLSALTGVPLHLYNIRARRAKPGLAAQHLQCVQAVAEICKAEVTGAALNATTITFRPGRLRSGRYRFDIGTAGAVMLVFQTVLLPLSRAGAASSISITGGTHVPQSPSFHYIDWHWLPYLKACGYAARLSLEQAGFYPPGGGRVDAAIRPAGRITPLDLTQRGRLVRLTGLAAVANLPTTIADRMKRQAVQRLQKLPELGPHPNLQVKIANLPAASKGAFLLLLAEFEGGRAAFCGLGELGKPAERVADEAVDALLAFLPTQAASDAHLADQLLLPLALAGAPSRLSTSRVTQHLLTNTAVLQRFLPTRIHIEGDLDAPGMVIIEPTPSAA